MNKELERRLVVGAKVKLGKQYCARTPKDSGTVITLVNGEFYYDNGLYGTTETAPAIWNEEQKEFDSIYHLFDNELDGFLDCEIVWSPADTPLTEEPKA